MDEIKLLSVEIENYRQYYGHHKIEFTSREDGFTVIFGYNGEGKSNFLNAINWCLYKDEPHGMGDEITEHQNDNKALPIINSRCIKEKKEETRADVKVDIWIQKGDTVYSITRTLGILKHKLEFMKLASGKEEMLLKDDLTGDRVPKGCEVLPPPLSKFVVTKKGPNDSDFEDTIRWSTPENIVKEILPSTLSRYFLLDGEFLQAFWKRTKNIREGIEQISQMHLISGTSENIQSCMMIPTKGFSKDTDDYTNKIKAFDRFENSKDDEGNELFTDEPRHKDDPEEEDLYYHSTGKPRIQDIADDIDRINNQVTNITADLKAMGGKGETNLKEKWGKLEVECGELETKYTEAGNTFLFNLITKGPQIMLKGAIQTSVDIIDKEIDLGGLPVKYKRIFAETLLEKKKCVCQEDLGPNDERTKHVEDFKKGLVGKEDKDDGAVLGYDYKKFFLNDYEKFCKDNFETPRSVHSKALDDYNKLDQELSGVKTLYANAGGDEGEKLLQKQEDLLERVKKLNQWKTKTETELHVNSKARGEVKRVLEKALDKNKRSRKAAHELKIWDKIAIALEKVYDGLKDEIREYVQDQTWKNYQSLLANDSEFESFDIQPDYTVHLLDKHSTNKARNLSAGQSLLMTIAFVAAIREPTGYRFPLVVDSPSGKIDGPNSHNVGMCLPDFLPDAQLTLLVTNKEYTDFMAPDPDNLKMPNTPVCKLFDSKGTCGCCGKPFGNIKVQHFKIKKDRKGDNVGNSAIVPAKLELIDHGDNQKGWAVVANE